jgi:hypothetical protein
MTEAGATGVALARLVELLDRHGIRDFAVTGSVALGAWVTPRILNAP